MIDRKDSDNSAIHNKKVKRRVRYISLIILFNFFIIAFIYALLHKQTAEDREYHQMSEVRDMRERVIAELNNVSADLLYYAHGELANKVLTSTDANAHSYLAALMQQISTIRKVYKQIRLFDNRGNEVIRFDLDSNFVLRQVPQEQLQNKSERYYYKNAITLQPEQIYISKFDLNIEYGIVQFPIEPMIRYSTPIHSKQGVLTGAATINFNGNKLLQVINELNIHKGDQVHLINSNGHYLNTEDVNKGWGFMFPDKQQLRFSEDFPNVWEKMQGTDSGKIVTQRGEFYFENFLLAPESSFNTVNKERVFIVMEVPKSLIYKDDMLLIQGLLIGTIFISPLLLLLGWRLADYQVEQAWLLEKLSFDASHDALTGLFNRKAIVDYLKKQLAQSQRNSTNLAVGFIDVNELKMTNDQLGHEAGDALIRGVATVINQSIRDSDFAARLGGDEFLIVLADCNEEHANILLQRIQARYSSLGMAETGKKWSLSFGCAELFDENDSAEKMIERADSAMYKHKTYQKLALKNQEPNG